MHFEFVLLLHPGSRSSCSEALNNGRKICLNKTQSRSWLVLILYQDCVPLPPCQRLCGTGDLVIWWWMIDYDSHLLVSFGQPAWFFSIMDTCDHDDDHSLSITPHLHPWPGCLVISIMDVEWSCNIIATLRTRWWVLLAEARNLSKSAIMSLESEISLQWFFWLWWSFTSSSSLTSGLGTGRADNTLVATTAHCRKKVVIDEAISSKDSTMMIASVNTGCFLSYVPIFCIKWKKNAKPTRNFVTLKIAWKSVTLICWLQLVFSFWFSRRNNAMVVNDKNSFTMSLCLPASYHLPACQVC